MKLPQNQLTADFELDYARQADRSHDELIAVYQHS
jgi:hypothetical protein